MSFKWRSLLFLLPLLSPWLLQGGCLTGLLRPVMRCRRSHPTRDENGWSPPLKKHIKLFTPTYGHTFSYLLCFNIYIYSVFFAVFVYQCYYYFDVLLHHFVDDLQVDMCCLDFILFDLILFAQSSNVFWVRDSDMIVDVWVVQRFEGFVVSDLGQVGFLSPRHKLREGSGAKVHPMEPQMEPKMAPRMEPKFIKPNVELEPRLVVCRAGTIVSGACLCGTQLVS